MTGPLIWFESQAWLESLLAAAVNHIWQSTAAACAAWLIALALRDNSARLRYGVWMVASLKFLFPLALLVEAGGWLRLLIVSPVVEHPAMTIVLREAAQPFPEPRWSAVAFSSAPASHPATLLPILCALWAGGVLIVMARWFRGWWRMRAIVRAAEPLDLTAGIRVRVSAAPVEPGVFGLYSPVLLLPAGLLARLTPAQLDAIVAHEMCHVRRRDNLTFAIHMLVEALFWFHPAVWWVGARLIEEREHACDEAVVKTGNRAEVYAEGILNVCKYCVESPLSCASGVTGADLKKRITRIVTNRVGADLTFRGRLLLGAAVSALLAVPILFVLLPGAGVEAQLLRPGGNAGPSFEVASVKQNSNAGDLFSFSLQSGRFLADGAPLDRLIRFAFDVKSDRQIVNMPSWAGSKRFDIDAKVSEAEMAAIKQLPPDEGFQQYRLMVQSLLADRFQMKVRTESQALPVYALVVAKNGSRLTPSATSPDTQKLTLPRLVFTAAGDLKAADVSMAFFAGWLSGKPDTGDRVVMDETGLKGSYDFALKWSPIENGSAANAGQEPGNALAIDAEKPPLLTAIQDQLGLKLESRKAPVDVLVIDHIEEPSPN